ncbi:MAG TPA: YceI family protein [Polyangiales bacterium]|nr:YceI family protein [Polyangiales bacterium]
MNTVSKPVAAFSITSLALLLLPLTAAATLGGVAAAHVQFVATGPAGLHIVGESAAVKLADDGNAITIVVPLATLETGIGLRDRHMKEKYLEVAKYPNAELVVERKTLRFPTGGAATSADGQGMFKLHGKQKQVSFHYEAKPAAGGFDVTGKVHVKITDFGIEQPSYMGMSVKPDVDAEVKFHVQGN